MSRSTGPQASIAPFEFGTAGRVIFGAGRSAELPGRVATWGGSALVVTGANPDRHAGLVSELPMRAELFAVTAEPTVDTAREAIAAARAAGADLVISIGGGSVLDLGKTVAMLLGNGGDPLDYLEVIGAGQPIAAPSVPMAAIPTTAGTGAEVTENAVLASPEHGRKASLRSTTMVPRLALVDPALTLGCPPSVTASSGLDALTQCLEPLVSLQASPVTDALARAGLSRAASGLRAAYADGGDISARTDMALASLLGGMALANAKLGAVHGFAGVIGGMVTAPHGAICAALLPAVVEVNVRALLARQPSSPALAKYRDAAALLTDNPAATIEDGIDWIRETVAQLAIPRLAELGVPTAAADDIVAKTRTASSTKGNPIALTDDELAQVLAAS
ncbi:MAG: iron-containing alcohol dehydrogenase [Nakamurella sp.]